MLTAGIDLASKPTKTAVCVIDWRPGRSAVIETWERSGWTDDKLTELMSDDKIDRVAIDAPFGWPTDYVDAISAFRQEGTWPEDGYDEDFGRFRMTERRLKEETGATPLSPSLGNLSWVVRRCARLLARQPRGEAVEAARRGKGSFIEVYPAVALTRWGISPADKSDVPGGYKGNEKEPLERRRKLVEDLGKELKGVVDLPSDKVAECKGANGDDLVDALIAALVARAMRCGRCDPIPRGLPPGQLAQEGWIRLPKGRGLRADLDAD